MTDDLEDNTTLHKLMRANSILTHMSDMRARAASLMQKTEYRGDLWNRVDHLMWNTKTAKETTEACQRIRGELAVLESSLRQSLEIVKEARATTLEVQAQYGEVTTIRTRIENGP